MVEGLYSPCHSHADNNTTSVSHILSDSVRCTACGDCHSGVVREISIRARALEQRSHLDSMHAFASFTVLQAARIV